MKKEQLIKDIDSAWENWDERLMFEIASEKLSQSDLDTLELYATYDGKLRKPVGVVAKVLDKYGYNS